jgi:hypothetical protein
VPSSSTVATAHPEMTMTDGGAADTSDLLVASDKVVRPNRAENWNAVGPSLPDALQSPTVARTAALMRGWLVVRRAP